MKIDPVNLWFNYPVHRIDDVGSLKDIQPDVEKPYWQKGKEARKRQGVEERKDKQAKYSMAIENFRFDHDDTYPTVKELYEQMKSDAEAVGEKYPAEKTIWNSLKKIGYTTDRETEQRKANAEQIKLQVEEWMLKLPLRMQRIVKYRYLEGLPWEKVAIKMGRKATADSVRMEMKNFLN